MVAFERNGPIKHPRPAQLKITPILLLVSLSSPSTKEKEAFNTSLGAQVAVPHAFKKAQSANPLVHKYTAKSLDIFKKDFNVLMKTAKFLLTKIQNLFEISSLLFSFLWAKSSWSFLT